jgi:signal transduction histidine kinase
MLINNDISQRVKLEEQLRQAHKMEALGTLAGGIAHDFNNLLMGIQINTDLALLDIQAGRLPSAESLLLASEGAKRGQELVRQIIAFSRQKEDRRRPVEVTPVFKEAMKFLKSTISASIEIRERVEAEPAVISANPIQIHQILMNLCNNAAHAMKEKGGILEIGSSPKSNAGDFLVQHTGKTGPHCGSR